jgi:hypothetical protein
MDALRLELRGTQQRLQAATLGAKADGQGEARQLREVKAALGECPPLRGCRSGVQASVDSEGHGGQGMRRDEVWKRDG